MYNFSCFCKLWIWFTTKTKKVKLIFYPPSWSYWVGCLWHSHGKNPVRLYQTLQSQPIGLPKIFIDYLFFQADQSGCTKSVSIFNRFASSEESRNQNVPCQICRPWVFPLVVWLVNQRTPSRYWQVTKGDLSQIVSSHRDSFLFRSSFFIRF